MESTLTNDRLIAFHRNKQDYEPSPPNSLQFAYGDRRYVKMTYELHNEPDELKQKTLEEINEDLARGDNINLILLSSDLTTVIIKHFLHSNGKIRELASRAIVIFFRTKKINTSLSYEEGVDLLFPRNNSPGGGETERVIALASLISGM